MASNPVAVLRDVLHNGSTYRDLWMWCPGCNVAHRATFAGPTGDLPPVCWEWDGNIDAPTLSPSLLVKGWGTCHSFVRAGRWEFLGDCTHALAGQTVPLPPVPDWLAAKA